MPRGADTLFPGRASAWGSILSSEGNSLAAPRLRVSISVPNTGDAHWLYHEQTRVIQTIALLPIGCESMGYQGIGPVDQRSGVLKRTHAGRIFGLSRAPSFDIGSGEDDPGLGWGVPCSLCHRKGWCGLMGGQGDDGGRFGAQSTARRAVKCFDPGQDYQRRKH